jgi:GT2 family glycosyltransferase
MILIGMCSGGDVKALTVMSLVDLFGTFPEPNALSLQIGGYKPHGMNNLVRDAKEINATHLLNIDSDMIFPPDALQKLLKADKDIVGVNYRQRGNHQDQDFTVSTIKFPNEDNTGYREVRVNDFPTELFECAAVGLGLTLIKMEVFDKLPFPWFRTTENKELHSTEDIVFCKDAREAGFEVWCDPTIQMKHIGHYLY